MALSTPSPRGKFARCSRCGRRARMNQRNASAWNATFDNGIVVGATCPECQTPEENTEAAINEATTDYVGFNAFGQMIGKPKRDKNSD